MNGFGFPDNPIHNADLGGPFRICCHEPDCFSSERGVAHAHLLERYLSALQSSFNMFVQFFGRPAPRALIEVKIFQTADVLRGATGSFSYVDGRGFPTICLPCGSGRQPTQLELEQAGASVYHEMTHVFNWEKRDPRLKESQPWLWLDEALASFIENRFGAMPFHLGHSPINQYPMDDPHAVELATLFLSFIEADSKEGLAAMFHFWDTDSESRYPTEAFGEGKTLTCFYGLIKAIYFHAGLFERTLLHSPATEIISLTATAPRQMRSGKLDHLSFRVFEVHVEPDLARSLEVRLTVPERKWDRLISAAIPVRVGTDNLMEAGCEYWLFGDDVDDLGGLQIPVGDASGEPVMRVNVIVCNCGTRGDEQLLLDGATPPGVHPEHDDGVDFEVSVALT